MKSANSIAPETPLTAFEMIDCAELGEALEPARVLGQRADAQPGL